MELSRSILAEITQVTGDIENNYPELENIWTNVLSLYLIKTIRLTKWTIRH